LNQSKETKGSFECIFVHSDFSLQLLGEITVGHMITFDEDQLPCLFENLFQIVTDTEGAEFDED
jgi:hypothetical protein